MLRLLPDQLVGGLFHGECWLSRKGVEHGCTPTAGADTPDALLAALSTLLDQHGSALRKCSRVSLVVSDSLAALSPLEWHAQLSSPEEIHAYARACFLKRGEEIDSGWIMQAAFRHHGQMGLAYALPRGWVEALVALLGARGLVLDRVLPLSAQAYWKRRRAAGASEELLLLREMNRSAALLYGANGLLALDAEAGAGSGHLASKRLLGRIAAYHPEIKLVQEWSEHGAQTRGSATFITESLADAAVESVHRAAWS